MPKKQTFAFLSEDWIWLAEVAICLFLALIFTFILKKSLKIFHKKSHEKESFWRKRVYQVFHFPLQIALWTFALGYSLVLICDHFELEAASKFVKVFTETVLVLGFTWMVLRFVREGFGHLSGRSASLGVNPGTIYTLNKLVTFVVGILSLLIIFQIFGLDIFPLLTFGGIGVAGIAFAAQDMIANFFGGAMLHATQSFSIGDDIVIPSQFNFEGTIKEVGWYITMAEDRQKRPVYFPNAIFSKTPVINESRRTHRRINEVIAIRYSDFASLEKMLEELKQVLTQHPEVDNSQNIVISFNKFGDHGLEISLYFLVFPTNFLHFMELKQQLLITVGRIVTKHGAEFCHPTFQVHLDPPFSLK